MTSLWKKEKNGVCSVCSYLHKQCTYTYSLFTLFLIMFKGHNYLSIKHGSQGQNE